MNIVHKLIVAFGVVTFSAPAMAASVWWGFPSGTSFVNNTGQDANDAHFVYEIVGGDKKLPRFDKGPFTGGGASQTSANFFGSTVANGDSAAINLFFKLPDNGAYPNITDAYWTYNNNRIGDIVDPGFTLWEQKDVANALGIAPGAIPLPAAAPLLLAALGALGFVARRRPSD